MNKKMVLLFLTSFSLLLWMLSSLFIAFVKAVPEGIGVEENHLTKQDFANVGSSCNRLCSFLRDDGDGVCTTGAVASPADIELHYDDGTDERGWTWDKAGCMFAVRFTPPTSGKLAECSFYIRGDPATFKVHILDGDKNDIISPFPETPTSTGWFHVDLSTYGIAVSLDVDFYVAMELTVASAPYLGDDTNNPDGRSWDYNNVEWLEYADGDYMIRAVIEIVTGVDLKITDVYWEPSEPTPGDDVTFYAGVENQGTTDAIDFISELYLDEECIASGTFSLAAGVNDTYYYTTSTPALGNHTVRWVIDAENIIDETNEDNNEMSKIFSVGYILTIQTPYSSITVKVDGKAYTTDANGKVQAKVSASSCTVEVPTHVSTGLGSREAFTRWSDGDSLNPRTVLINGHLTLTAEYTTQFYLTVDTNPGGVGGTTGEGWYNSGSMARANSTTPVSIGVGERYAFANWTGDISGSSQSVSITMDGPKTVTANYKIQYQVTVKQSGCGTTVSAMIDGDSHDLPRDFWFDKDSEHSISVPSTVTSNSDTRYVFTKWHDDETSLSRIIAVTSPAEHTAYYKTQYKVIFQQSGSEGTPHIIIDDVTHSAPCSFWFDADSTHSFDYESLVDGEVGIRCILTSTSHTSPITSVGQMTVSGYYKKQYYLTVGVDPQGITTVSGEGWYDAETIATTGTAELTISGVDLQYDFDTWRVDGADVSGNPLSVTMDSPHTAIAIYKTLKASSIPPLSLSSDTIKIDKPITVSGSIVPAHEGVTVTLTYERPDGSTLTRTVTLSSAGTFSATYTPDASGTWRVTASWPGDVDNLGATSPSTSFKVEPIGWQDYLAKPEVIGLVIGLFSVICTVTAFVATRRKRGRVKALLNEIDDAYLRFKLKARRCEAELYRLKDIVLEEYKSGKIIEASYNILNERIDAYLKEIRVQIIDEKLGGFPSKLRDELHRMIEKREITTKEFSALEKLLTRTAGLTESAKEELRSLLEKWKKDSLRD